MTTVTSAQVNDAMADFEMDYPYACRLDGSCLTIDVDDAIEGRGLARRLGILGEPMDTEPFGEMVRCSWATVTVVD